jgi:hypothetical protein
MTILYTNKKGRTLNTIEKYYLHLWRSRHWQPIQWQINSDAQHHISDDLA